MSANDAPRAQQPSATYDSAFLKACRREPVPHTPVWFMRQAGRSLPEYRKVREGIPMLESCMRPELVTEITLQPVRRHGVDAAIYFSDIVVPLKAIGVDLDIKPGVGPVVERPIRTRADLAQLRDLTPEDVSYVTEAIGLLTRELGATPLIGFAGAPFTLASYLVEGGPSRTYENAKAMMYGDPELWADLLDRLAGITAAFLKVQIEAGASAVQLFDSWAGALAPADYRRSVLQASAKVFDAVAGYG
ncbi:uroporphyrinogen decarboxylase family protein, partial [Streptomyces sp. NRRL S-481]|uniref:uroporphyrinogen decarboxylase family protein n=1 Tax=Streptomyces sp. NRRL S-481 TaxID=1463911 RepID=UPI0004CBB17E